MKSYLWRALAALPALLLGAGSAGAECKLTFGLDLPVTMSGLRPLVDARINDVAGQFILDSGAFYSLLSPGMASATKVRLTPAPEWFHLSGIGGSTSASYTTVKTLSVAGKAFPPLDFFVGGSDTGVAGLLGQNILGLGDVEYDLPEGHVRLFKWQGCGDVIKAYWVKGGSYSELKIDPRSQSHPHTTGTVSINGTPMHVTFDTGAPMTTLSLRAAARLGIKPDSPGVRPAGHSMGLGRKVLESWSAPVGTIRIGDEEIQNARILMSDLGDADDLDMLIGADFFISHRVYVDNSQHRMIFTYTGGPLFNQKASAGANAPVAAQSTAGASEPSDAEGFSRRGAVAASQHDLTRAFADFDRAIELAPKEPRYLVQRAEARLQNRQPLLALADLDKAIAIDPSNVRALLERAQLNIGRGRREAALPDLDAAARAALPATNDRLRIAQLYEAAAAYERAIAQYDLWIPVHPEDHGLPQALNGRCWTRALANQDLGKALDDCNRALRLAPHTASFLDSRGLVRLRMGDWDHAIADYDESLQLAPKSAWSLYGRGLARRHKGLAAEGDADIAAAAAIAPDLAERAKKLGIG